MVVEGGGRGEVEGWEERGRENEREKKNGRYKKKKENGEKEEEIICGDEKDAFGSDSAKEYWRNSNELYEGTDSRSTVKIYTPLPTP